MRLIFVTDETSTIGGIQSLVNILASEFAALGHETWTVGIFDAEGLDTEKRTLRLGAPLDGDMARKSVAVERMNSFLNAFDNGIVVTQSVRSALWMQNVSAAHLDRIAQYHGSYDYWRTSYHYDFLRRHWQDFRLVGVSSPEDATNFYAAGVKNAVWLPNPVRMDPVARTKSASDGPVILGAGRFTAVKRFDRLLTAFAANSSLGWRLKMVGDGELLPDLIALASELGIRDKVEFAGARDHDGMAVEYVNADVIALTSEHEAFGTVLAEAAMCGLPAVAFDVSGGVRSIVRHGVTGILVPPADDGALASALRDLMTDMSLLATLASATVDHVAIFRPRNAISSWLRMLDSAMS